MHTASAKNGDVDYESVVKLAGGLNVCCMGIIWNEDGLLAIWADRAYLLDYDFMKATRKILDNKSLKVNWL